jgi:hypothetical protein
MATAECRPLTRLEVRGRSFARGRAVSSAMPADDSSGARLVMRTAIARSVAASAAPQKRS